MKDNWLDDLGNRMKDHKMDPPENLWEDIHKEIFKEEEGKIINLNFPALEETKNKPGKTFSPAIGGKFWFVAATVLVFLTCGAMFFYYNSDIDIFNNKFAINTGNSKLNEAGKPSALDDYLEKPANNDEAVNIADGESGTSISISSILRDAKTIFSEGENVILHAQHSVKNRSNNILNFKNAKNNLFLLPNKDISQKPNNITTNPLMNANAGAEDELQPDRSNRSLEKNEEVASSGNDNKNKAKDRFFFGPNSNQLASNASSQNIGYTTMNGLPFTSSASSAAHNPMAEIMLSNTQEEVYTKINHKAPLNYSLSIGYRLNDKTSIISGVTYTKLSSESRAGLRTNYVKTKQDLHYVGVPVQITRQIWQKNNTTLYANAGFSVQKAIAGNTRTDYIVNNNSEIREDEKIKDLPVQLSFSTGIGVDYKIYKNVSVFAEPGVAYHVNDGSSLNTAYKEKPFNITINSGIRISIR